MKTTLSALAALTVATPALAHADGSFHTHGAEAYFALAVVAVIAAVTLRLTR